MVDPLAGVDRVLEGLDVINRWLDHMAALPADAADHDVVQALTVGLGHADAAAQAALAGTIVLAEEAGCALADGQTSPTAWIAQQLRLSATAAARACRLAADLDDAPDVVAALRAGRISRDHAQQLATAARQQRADHAAAERDRRDAEARAIAQAQQAAEQAARAAADAAERQRILDAARAEQARRQAAADQAAAARRAQAERAERQRRAELLRRAAGGHTPEEVAEEAARRRAGDPDAVRRREAAQRAARQVSTWTDRDTGSGCGRWTLPADHHDKMLALLESFRTQDDPDAEPDEQRTFAQRQADALIDVIELAVRSGEAPTTRGEKPQLAATVPMDWLAPREIDFTPPPGMVTTRHGMHLSAAAIQRIACDATITRLVLSATSQVMDVGRATRRWTTAQHKAAEATFGGCAFPVGDRRACGRPMGWTDLHHVRWWRHGGATDQDNGVPLCARHHDMVHHAGWHLTYDHTRLTVTVTHRRPDGTRLHRQVSFARPADTLARSGSLARSDTLPTSDSRSGRPMLTATATASSGPLVGAAAGGAATGGAARREPARLPI